MVYWFNNLWEWVKAYLSSRFQCVALNNIHSDLLPVLSGVPQGSILGPLLFLVFVNDLPPVVSSSNVLHFASDTKCHHEIRHPSDCLLLQWDVNYLALWSNKWHFQFNESNCVLIRFYPNYKSPAVLSHTYLLNGEPVTPRDNHRSWGHYVR